MKNSITLGLIVLLLLGCKNQPESLEGKIGEPPFHINLASMIDGELVYSDFIEDIEYVKLETHTDHLIGSGGVYLCPDGFLIDDNESELTVFSHKGQFISSVGNIGKGPGEYPYANSPQVDHGNNNVYFQLQTNSVIKYSLDGSYIGRIEIKDFQELTDVWFHKGLFYLSGLDYTTGDYYHPIRVYNLDGDSLQVIRLDFPQIEAINWTPFASFLTSIDDQLLIQNIYPDTIHTFQDGQLKPFMIMDLNNEGLKYKERFNLDVKRKRRGQYTSIQLIGDYGPIIIMGLQIKEEEYAIYYDKRSSQVFQLGMWKDLAQDRSRIFRNDLDCGLGPSLFYIGTNYDGYSLLQAIDLIEYYESGELENAECLHPDKKKELIKLIQTLDETDNPVVMKVKFIRQK